MKDNTYLFKVKWYNRFQDKTLVNCGVVASETYSGAVELISRKFLTIDELFVVKLDDLGGFFFLTEEEFLNNYKEQINKNKLEG